MRFSWRVFGAAVLLVVASTLLVQEQVATRLAADRRSEIGRRLGEDAWLLRRLVAAHLEAEDGGPARGEGLQPLRDGAPSAALTALLAEAVAALPGRRLTVIAADGRVLADSHEDPALMEDHGARPEVLAPGEPVERHSRTLDRPMLYLALPLAVDGRAEGFVRVALSAEDVRGELAALRATARRSALLAVLAGVLLAAVIARRVAAPVERIEALVEALARGERPRPLPTAGRGGVGRLSAALNVMVESLQRREDRIGAEVGQKGAILAAMDEGVLALDRDGRVLLANDAAQRILEARRLPLVGRRLAELTRVPEVLEAVERCLSERERVVHEFSGGGPQGERVVLLTATPLPDSDAACVLVLHDLTEVRRLEKMRRDFVANVSHELKTPLTAMRGYLEALADDPQMPEGQRQLFLGKARANTDRLADIVRDLLDLARLEADRGAMRQETVDLTEVALGCLERARDGGAGRGVRVQAGATEGPLVVRGDARALATAVGNLLDNAVKYSPDGGRVELSTGRERAWAWVEVKDEGPGIPPHEQERIFERFYRVDKDRDRRVGGTGLGLSIVRNVARVHGGEVSVASALGVGSVFRLRLPLAEGAAAMASAESAGAGPPGSRAAETRSPPPRDASSADHG